MDKITELVGKDYTIMTYALTTSTSAANDQLTKLQAEKIAITSVMNTIRTDLSVGIHEKAISISKTEYFDVSYGGITVRDWGIGVLSEISLSGISYISATQFKCIGDKTNIFTTSKPIIISNTTLSSSVSGSIRSFVSSSSYDLGYTYINVSGIGIPSSISHVYSITTSHTSTAGIYSDQIEKWMDDYDFAYDHLNCPVGVNGTYGINARIASLSTGMTIVDANKTKQDNMDNVYRQYTTWSPLVSISAGTLEYDDTAPDNIISFYCSGDMTTNIPSGSDLLIDCGVDKQKGCKVTKVEYIPVSAASYTECTLIMDINAYMTSPSTSAVATSAMYMTFDDAFQTISVSGSDIHGAIYVDGVTFVCPGNMESVLLSGGVDNVGATQLVATFGPSTEEYFSPRYFTVYNSIHLSNPHANQTKVTIGEGLPITQNIETVSITP